MNWYKQAQQAYKSKEVPVPNNLAEQWVEFEEDGYYWGSRLEDVPIEKIEYEPWNKERLQRVLEGLKQGAELPPVRLSYDEERDVYRVSDGNHRVEGAKLIGHTHVPAIVSRKITEKPQKPPVDEIQYVEMSNESFKAINAIRDFGRQNLNQFDIIWDTTSPNGYVWLISHAGTWEEAPFTVNRVDDNIRTATLSFNGDQLNSTGPIDQILKELEEFLRRAF